MSRWSRNPGSTTARNSGATLPLEHKQMTTPARDKSQWREIFKPQTDGAPTKIGDRIIGDLWGYRQYQNERKGVRNRYRDQDAESLGAALEAYHDPAIRACLLLVTAYLRGEGTAA